MKLLTWIRLFFICLLALGAILIAAPEVMADPDDDCQGNPHHCNGGGGDVNVPVDVSTNINGGPVSVEHKSKSLGLSNGMGDVDIAGCLGSTQWATPLFSKQKLVVNWPCLAEFYLRNEQYALAAMAICNTEVVEEFDSEAACEAAHHFAPPPEPIPVASLLDEVELFHEEDIQQVQMQQQDIVARLEALEKRPKPVARAPAPAPAFTEEQKAAAWAALVGGGEDEDDE